MKQLVIAGLIAALLAPTAVQARDQNHGNRPGWADNQDRDRTGNRTDHRTDRRHGDARQPPAVHRDDHRRDLSRDDRRRQEQRRDAHRRDQQKRLEEQRREAARDRARWEARRHEAARDRHDSYRGGYRDGRRDQWRIEDRQRKAAREWYRHHQNRWYRPVPQWVRYRAVPNGYLPRGYYQPAPYDLVRVLPRAPYGQGYYLVGSDVVLAAVTTGLVFALVANLAD